MSTTPRTEDSAAEENRQEVKLTWTVSSLTMMSRVLGFLRLVLLVQLFSHMRWASDAFIFAFRIPNLFRNLLGEGALSSAFIPAFVKTLRKDGAVSAGALGSQAFTLLSVLGGLLAAVGIAVCLVLDHFTTSREISLALNLTALLFPFMPLVCLAALLGGMLQSLRRFALPAALSIILNLGFLAGFAYVYWWQAGGDLGQLRADASTYAISVFVIAAGLIEVIIQLPALAAAGIRVRPTLSLSHPGIRQTMAAFLPVALGLGLVQINAFFDSLIAGWLSLASAGAVTYLEIAFRFVQLPLGVFGVAIATVTFPALAENAALGDAEGFFTRCIRAVRMSLFLLLPSAAVLIAMADPIIRLVCQRPDLDFSHVAVYRTSAALILYALGLVFYSLRQILVRAYYAQGEYSYPVKVSAIMVGLNLVLNLTLIHCPDLYRLWSDGYYERWFLTESSFPGGLSLGEAGLALATCITAIVDTTVLGLGLRKRLVVGLSPAVKVVEFRKLAVTAIRMLLVSVALGLLTYLYRNSIPYDPRFYRLLIRGIVPCILAGGTFYIFAIVLPVPEVNEFLLGMFRRKRRG